MTLENLPFSESLAAEVRSLPWHHEIDFGNGLLSPGDEKIGVLRAQADAYFAEGIAGKSFLDIGCWDGFNSFEASRRGALRVLATDHFAWSEKCWGDRRSFEIARAHLAPSVQVLDIDLPDMAESMIGRFDIVLFAGVLYHLRHPFAMLEKLAPLALETFIVETHLDAADVPRPAMIFYPGSELNNDHTNWWGPNRVCVEAMLKDVGFDDVSYQDHPNHPSRIPSFLTPT
jgi:tRNA (mo5U34)-methyltransferase